MKKLLYIVLVIFSSGLVQARTVTEIIDSKRLIVGIPADNPPLAYQDQTTSLIGFDVDMARQLARAMKVALVFMVVDKQNLAEALAADKFDIAMGGITYSHELSRRFLLSKRVIPDGIATLTLCQSPHKIKKITELYNSNTIIINSDAYITAFALKYVPNASLYPLENNINPLNLLSYKNSDIIITDLIHANYYRYYYPKLCFATKVPLVGSRSYKAYMTQKNNIELMKIINDWLKITDREQIALKWHINLALN